MPAEPESAPKADQEPPRQGTGWHGPLAPHLCGECYPDGWPDRVTGLGCPHGIWTRRL